MKKDMWLEQVTVELEGKYGFRKEDWEFWLGPSDHYMYTPSEFVEYVLKEEVESRR